MSAYGYTGMLAERIAQGVRDSGEIDVRVYDMVKADGAKVREEMQWGGRDPLGNAYHPGGRPAAHLGAGS